MAVIIHLTKDNTTLNDQAEANLKVTVPLSEEWQYISTHSHIYVSTELLIPVLVQKETKLFSIKLQNFFRTNGIADPKDPCIYQYGVVQGQVINSAQIQSKCTIWAYDMSCFKEEESNDSDQQSDS